MFILGLIIGLFIGSFIGLLGAALCVAAKKGDEHIERLCQEQERFLVPEDRY